MKNNRLSYSLLALVISLFLITPVKAQKQLNVLDWKTDVSLNAYLSQQMQLQYQTRAITLNKALQTKSGVLTYIQSVRQKIKTVFGEFPQKSELNPQITGTIQQNGYRIEKIVYQSFKSHHVTANLYIPNGKGKFPSVLLFCGHEDLSKATPSYQQTAILFAKNGFVVFVIDPISQSERVQLTDQAGKSLTRGSTTEHTLLNLSSNLLGTSTAAYELFDNKRGLDYLITRPEVDGTKIGCIGNSGGAMQAIYFAGIDDRIKIVAPCSYLASRALTLSTTGAADGCAQLPNEGLAQLEMNDYLIAAAPKPILVLAGRYDFIDYNGTLQSYNELKAVYQQLNASEHLKLFTYDDGHGISKPKREAAVQWFRKWFYKDNTVIKEDSLTVLSDQELFASSKGKVSTSYPDEINIVQKNLLLYQQKAVNRQLFSAQPLLAKQAKVKQLLGMNTSTMPVDVELKEKVNHKGITFTKLILRSANQLPIPVLLSMPQQQAQKVKILISDFGKYKLADSIALMQAYLQQGYALVLADLSGTGETTDKAELNDPKYFSSDYRNAGLALHVGKPLLGQRTKEVLILMSYIQQQPQFKELPVELKAQGLVGVAALHASLFNSKLHKTELSHCISSYQEVLQQPLEKNRYGLVIPDVLSYYDLPDLIQWIGKTKVQFLDKN